MGLPRRMGSPQPLGTSLCVGAPHPKGLLSNSQSRTKRPSELAPPPPPARSPAPHGGARLSADAPPPALLMRNAQKGAASGAGASQPPQISAHEPACGRLPRRPHCPKPGVVASLRNRRELARLSRLGRKWRRRRVAPLPRVGARASARAAPTGDAAHTSSPFSKNDVRRFQHPQLVRAAHVVAGHGICAGARAPNFRLKSSSVGSPGPGGARRGRSGPVLGVPSPLRRSTQDLEGPMHVNVGATKAGVRWGFAVPPTLVQLRAL